MKFHIPEPCHEKWNEMTPTEKGAFCQKCALEVTDFTKKSPYEIRDILTEKYQNKERACAHISQRQINEVNDIGFYWRNEQHRFQSVWMVSLLAVFGLTLFSCQNTFTKEMVSEMEEKGQVLLEDDETNFESEPDQPVKVTSDTLPTGVNISTSELDVHFDGLVSIIQPEEVTISCETLIMGDMIIVSGSIISPDEDTNPEELMARFNRRTPQLPEGTERVAPQPRNNVGTRAEMVYNTETDDFIAYISPAPLQINSRLIVESFDAIELHIVLENMESKFQHTNKTVNLNEGVHTFDLNLDRLPMGNYRMELQTWKTRQSIELIWQKPGIESV